VGTLSEIQHWKQVDFQSHITDIRNKKHWWTDINFDYDWGRHMRLVDTHPEKMYDWNRDKQRLGLNSFHRRPSSPQFAKDIFADMEDFFVSKAPTKNNDEYTKGPPQITNIAFCGFGRYTGSYPRHKDSMDVFLIQVLGDTPIRIGYTEERTEADEDKIMKPGDAVWIPRGTWHQLTPVASRVTFSFGFESDPDCDPSTFI
jgi:mannose-6-phosphate isomerase-like protein (cupin superfamily)